MAQDFSNYINTYKGSSVLQNQFPNMNDYLALFGYNQGTTPSSATTSTTPSTPSTSSGVQGIINQNINQYQRDGGGGIPSSPIGLTQDFMTATQNRTNNLTNPNMIQGIINSGMSKIGMTPQRSIGEMISSGQVDVRNTSGIPLGIGAAIGKMLPDNYYNMSLGDQIFTQSQMGYDGPTVFGENNMGNKDPFGLNVRSGFGNYAEAVGENFNSLRESLTGRLSDKYGVEFDEETGMYTGKNLDAVKKANDMTKMMRTKFNFRKQQLDAKNRLDAQIKAAEEKRKAEAARKVAQAAQEQSNQSRINRAYREETGGQGGSYATGESGVQSDGSYNDPFDPGGGEKDGGLIGYRNGGRVGFKKGGLATMFKLKG